ncbi:MAG: glycosyltransferase, partial [Desulfomonilia bacterium]|nr:glycosyltransferase [Desulfomonilia bacterium]
VVVLTPRIYAQSPLREQDSGVTIYRFRFPSGNRPLNQVEGIPLVPMAIYMVSGFFTALSCIIREKPDVIHGNWIVPTGLIAALAGRITGVPVINTARGMDLRISERFPVRMLFDWAVKLSDEVNVVSASMKNRPSLKDAEVISSGVDDAFFAVTPNRTAQRVLSTRSLEAVYDVRTLIESIPLVLERIPVARFVIAGTGSQEQELKGRAAELGIGHQVEFPGLVDTERILGLMHESSVYVSCAVADGTSIALMEAIAAGLIPVVTDIEPNRPLVSGGKDGFLFRPGDKHDLAQKIILALTEGVPPPVLDQKRSDFNDMIRWSSVANRVISSYNRLAVK